MGIFAFASSIEVIQLVCAMVALGFGFWRLWIAIENGLAATVTASNDVRRIVAETQVIGELVRLFKMGCLVAMGVISVLLPPPNDFNAAPDMYEPLQGVLIRLGLILLTLTMVFDSMVQEYRRQKFLSHIEITTRLLRRHTDINGDELKDTL